MGLWDNIKNIMTIPEEDEEFEEEVEERSSHSYTEEESYEEPAPRRERTESPRIIRRSQGAKNQAPSNGQMQVVLVKPERFDDVTGIADNLNAGRTVVLNLEEAERDISRRIVDFLSGAAYANGCNMRKVAKNTFIIVARGVDVAGELMLDDFDDSKLYY